jgi:hypothetical protein
MKLDVVEGVRASYAPGDELEACVELGRQVAKELKAKL